MIDMGMVKGERVFYTGGRSLRELMEDGEVLAIPDAETGIIYKRPESCSEIERRAALTVEEARAITEGWNANL